MIIVHQAIYGDKDGSYALLSSSHEDEAEARRLCNSTDLRERPDVGIEWSSAIRGYLHGNNYIFLKTIKDTSPGVRQGRTLSHALIIKKEDLKEINDLDSILKLFPTEIDKHLKVNLVEIDINSFRYDKVEESSREAKVINALLDYDQYKNTIVWVGQVGFINLITKIWNCIPPALRETLSFGIGFNPREVETGNLNIITIPSALASQWQKNGYCIVSVEDREQLNSTAAYFLAGNKEKAKDIELFISKLGVEIKVIADILVLEKAIDILQELPTIKRLQGILPLADIISKYSSDENIGKDIKTPVLQKLLALIPSATEKEMLVLRTTNLVGYNDINNDIKTHVKTWSKKNLLESSGDYTNIISVAFDKTTPETWWTDAIKNIVKDKLANWKTQYAVTLWKWWLTNHMLVNAVSMMIPTNNKAEKDLVDNFPANCKEDLLKEIQALSKLKGWYSLYGITLIKMHSTEQAFDKLLSLAGEGNIMEGLKRMASYIPDEELLEVAVKKNNSHLSKIASECIAANLNLLSKIDVRTEVWRSIWLESMSESSDPWKGINQPKQLLYTLLDEQLDNNNVDMTLLRKLAKGPYADLNDYPRRSEAWKMLHPEVAKAFLKETAIASLSRICKGELLSNAIDLEVRREIINESTISEMLNGISLSVTEKIRLFANFTELQEQTFIEFINNTHFQLSDSIYLGELIIKKNWKKSSSFIAQNVKYRHDLSAALAECKYLLGFFERGMLILDGLLTNSTLIEREWWDEFTEICIRVYPRGPMDRGLWVQAGGDESDLTSRATGREIWIDVLRRLRENAYRKISTERLIEVMIYDNPKNNQIKVLKNLYQKL